MRPIVSSRAKMTADAEEIVLAIRRGDIDALVMQGSHGEKVVTLQGTEHLRTKSGRTSEHTDRESSRSRMFNAILGARSRWKGNGDGKSERR